MGNLDELDQEKKSLEQYEKDLQVLGQYDQPDRVITSKEAQELADADRKIPTINTGIQEIDDLLGGFRPGQLVVISAPTGQGKTTFCQTLTTKFEKQGIGCLWFSYEVGISEFLDKFEGTPVFYLPKELKQNSMEWLEHRIMESIAKYDCKIVFIDHLHYLLEMQKMAQAQSISLLIGMMVRELKKMAIKHGMTIFLVSHMRKLMYDKMPEIDDLRDSSFVGQEADIVMFLKRKIDGKGENAVATDRCLLSIAKNRRTGSLGFVNLQMVGKEFVTINKNYAEITPPSYLKEDEGDREQTFGLGI